jgi:hypothetical protein
MSDHISQQVTFITREIYDSEHDTSYFLKDHDDLPGLLVLQYRDSIKNKIEDCSTFTADQAEAVGKALIQAAQELRAAERRSIRADASQG